MSKYVLVYHGGGKTPESDEEKDQIMAAWRQWIQSAGESLVDVGNPFGPPDSIGGQASDPATGYSIIEADNVDGVKALLGNHPMAGADGARIDIHEAFNM
ncbi:MAG: hypothetical protein JJE13_02285 [Thermoleophilia bacterium]|nr:hypothetical protein [Thermoleophilia bacterium]